MPLIRTEHIEPDAVLGLWHLTESPDELAARLSVDFCNVRSQTWRNERLGTYALLKAMTGDEQLTIRHLTSGKPILEGRKISLSHTKGWIALILAKSKEVAVDIEYFSERVNKVASRFIREDEQNDSTERRLINWSVKETVYKFYSEQELHYFDMRLQPFMIAEKGEVTVDNLKTDVQLTVTYRLNDAFVLTYAVEKGVAAIE